VKRLLDLQQGECLREYCGATSRCTTERVPERELCTYGWIYSRANG